MSVSKPPSKSPDDSAKRQVKVKEPPRHQHTFEGTNLHLMSDAATDIISSAPSDVLSRAPSAILQEQAASSADVGARLVSQADRPRPHFRGRSFAGLPVHVATKPASVEAPSLTLAADQHDSSPQRGASELVSRSKSDLSLTAPSRLARSDIPCGTNANMPPAPLVPQTLIDAAVHEAEIHSTQLRAEYVRQQLSGRQSNKELNTTFERLIISLPNSDSAHIQAGAQELIELLERQWVLDSNTSSLDLLSPDQRHRYRDFGWDPLDYPGHAKDEPAGPNEDRAEQMMHDLTKIQSERRPNIGSKAVVIGSQFTGSAELQTFVHAQLRPVPDLPTVKGHPAPPSQSDQRLNQIALTDFIRMRDAALQDGVQLVIINGYRSPETSKKRSKDQNPKAIAKYSAHNLGLAVDLRMSAGRQRYNEIKTHPMQNVVNMHQSPVHKWMFLHGPQYGWFPWHHEPWHWEYNPPGFREQFQADFQASTAVLEAPNSITR